MNSNEKRWIADHEEGAEAMGTPPLPPLSYAEWKAANADYSASLDPPVKVARCACCGHDGTMPKYTGMSGERLGAFRGWLVFCQSCGQIYIKTEIGPGFTPCLSAVRI